MQNLQLYFVALIPPEPICTEVKQIKEEVWEKYGSKAALKSPPHITLHMPFKWREDREDRIIDSLKTAVCQLDTFEIAHLGFGCFEPRVIFVDVQMSQALDSLKEKVVKQMRRDLKLLNADYKDRPFHPHMTIAFRDLKKSIFTEAWSGYENRMYKANWECGSVFLLKHTGKEWSIFEEVVF